jgi:hypothetical protein
VGTEAVGMMFTFDSIRGYVASVSIHDRNQDGVNRHLDVHLEFTTDGDVLKELLREMKKDSQIHLRDAIYHELKLKVEEL